MKQQVCPKMSQLKFGAAGDRMMQIIKIRKG